MTCQDALQQMTDYLKGKLTKKEEMALISHVESCEDCFEELELNYIMQVGLDELDKEPGGSMDFTAMLREYMKDSRRKYKRERRIRRFVISGILFTILLIAGLLAYILVFM